MAKTALITGANKSIGYEAARRLGALGYRIWLGSRDAAHSWRADSRDRESGRDPHRRLLGRPTALSASATEARRRRSSAPAMANQQDPAWAAQTLEARGRELCFPSIARALNGEA